MNAQKLRDALENMASVPGIDGCALVEVETGMVWHGAGNIPGLQFLSEAASDYWRLNQRMNHVFQELGELTVAAFVHTKGRITMLTCGKGMVVVALTKQGSTVEWSEWQKRAAQLSALVAKL